MQDKIMYNKVVISLFIITVIALNVTTYASEPISEDDHFDRSVASKIINQEVTTDGEIARFNHINEYKNMILPVPDPKRRSGFYYSHEDDKVIMRRDLERTIFTYLFEIKQGPLNLAKYYAFSKYRAHELTTAQQAEHQKLIEQGHLYQERAKDLIDNKCLHAREFFSEIRGLESQLYFIHCT